ncbi:MAG: hypothetical protein U0235_35215 [Polyangiaceae bacterium]
MADMSATERARVVARSNALGIRARDGYMPAGAMKACRAYRICTSSVALGGFVPGLRR